MQDTTQLEPEFVHKPEPYRISILMYGGDYEPLEFNFTERGNVHRNVENAKFEARWQGRPMVKVRNSRGEIIYNGSSEA